MQRSRTALCLQHAPRRPHAVDLIIMLQPPCHGDPGMHRLQQPEEGLLQQDIIYFDDAAAP